MLSDLRKIIVAVGPQAKALIAFLLANRAQIALFLQALVIALNLKGHAADGDVLPRDVVVECVAVGCSQADAEELVRACAC